MARLRILKRYLTAATWCAVFTGVAIILLMAPEGSRLRLINVAIPMVTIVMLVVIWRRQRRTAELAKARLDKSADVCTRVAALSDVLEGEYLEKRLKSSSDRSSVRCDHVLPSDDRGGRTIH